MKKLFIISFLFISFICNLKAAELCTPSEEYIEYSKLSDEEKKDFIEPVYCEQIKDVEDKNADIKVKSNIKNIFNTMLSSYPASYNAVNDNIVTSIKHQYSLGTCWSFSATSVVETNALKNGLPRYDFSEKHMIYSLLSVAYSDDAGKVGKYKVDNFNGGGITYAASYYFNGLGQLNESEMPYDRNGNPISSSEYIPGKRMISISDYELFNVNSLSVCSTTEIDTIKSRILRDGSVQGSMYMDESLFKDTNEDYYISTTSNSLNPNHAITIVGWDDTISKTKFEGATRDGAWIIKNSWGSTWSNDGYFYISYDDHFICKNISSYSGVSNTTYDNTYKASDMVGVPTIVFENKVYESARFNKKTTSLEKLKRVSFAVGQYTSYKVYLSKTNSINNNSGWILLGTGTSDNYSIKSIDLDTPLDINDDFTIIVELNVESGKETSAFTMCDLTYDTSEMEYSSNRNFISFGGYSWVDMGSINLGNTNIKCEPNIYAYTDTSNEGFVTINSVDVNNNNVTISTSTDADINSFTYKVLDSSNNDVTNKFTINKDNSNKKITLTTNNSFSGGYKLVIGYINLEQSVTFELVEIVNTNNSAIIINSNDSAILVSIENNPITLREFMNKIAVYNSTASLLDANNNPINDLTQNIKTNVKLKTNNTVYNISVLGDVNADGRISALDYIEIRKHIMGDIITDSGRLKAADMDKNSAISALDYIQIRKILMR